MTVDFVQHQWIMLPAKLASWADFRHRNAIRCTYADNPW